MCHIVQNLKSYPLFPDEHFLLVLSKLWIESLSCLKRCGMGIAEMKEYVALCLEGENSIPKRKIILDKKKELLEEKLQEVQDCIDYINSKQQFYDDVLSGKIKYKSNLIIVDDEKN